MTFRKLAYGVSAAAIMMSASTAVFAQETTGAIRGRILDGSGAAVVGSVTIVHEPTGTTVTTMSDSSGFYSARGLRAGGPYTVTVSSAAGEGGIQLDSIGVGDAVNGDVIVNQAAAELEAITVTGQRFSNDFGYGTGSNYGAGDIAAAASISRDPKDIARLDPFVTLDPSNEDALSFAGTNTRQNQFTVDGIRQNDEFGLNGNGYPTQRSPISIDAIQALNVSVAPQVFSSKTRL